MERHYFYVPDLKPREKKVTVLGEEFYHLDKVLRLKAKDKIFLLNGKGWVFKGQIYNKTKKSAEVKILSFIQSPEPKLKIHLIPALLPSESMDFLIRTSAEVGVWQITPVITANCIVRFKDKKVIATKLLRWQKILIQGIKQSGNPWLPKLDDIRDFQSVVKNLEDRQMPKFILTQNGLEINSQVFLQIENEIVLLIGPEGGFTEEEIELAQESGFVPLSLGTLRWRSQITALMAVIIFKYSYLYFQSQDEVLS